MANKYRFHYLTPRRGHFEEAQIVHIGQDKEFNADDDISAEKIAEGIIAKVEKVTSLYDSKLVRGGTFVELVRIIRSETHEFPS
jgi:hypothetical protein